jgi:flagellar biosynthesis component FlhA
LEAPPPPTLAVALTIDAELLIALRDGRDPLLGAVSEAVTRGLEQLRQGLGVPGKVLLEVAGFEKSEGANRQWLTLSVNGAACVYPDEALRWVYSYVSGQHVTWARGTHDLLLALKGACSASPAKERAVVAAFFAMACLDIVTRQPSCFLGPDALGVYLHEAQLAAEDGASQRLLPVFRELLDLGLSIADRERVAAILRASHDSGLDKIVEDLVEALRPDEIEVRLSESHLQQLTGSAPAAAKELFAFLREGLFTELGALYPVIRLVLDNQLDARSFAFTINHLVTTPFRGLDPDEILVNDTADRLATIYKVPAEPTLNPATWQPAAITSQDQKSSLEGKGLTTWDPWGYLILSLAATLRGRGGVFVHRPFVEYRLERLAEEVPVVVDQLRQRYRPEQLVYLLRALAAEQVSTRDLRQICERLLDRELDELEDCRLSILGDRVSTPDVAIGGPAAGDDSPAGLLRFLRRGLNRQLSHKFARGSETVIVYVLDESLERLLLEASTGINDAQRERVLSAVRTTLDGKPPTAATPCLLTFGRLRATLREMTRVALPLLAIISYDDISSQMNVQAAERISLG